MIVMTIEDPYPLRFRSVEEYHRYSDGEIGMAALPQPGTVEYINAPYEVAVIIRGP